MPPKKSIKFSPKNDSPKKNTSKKSSTTINMSEKKIKSETKSEIKSEIKNEIKLDDIESFTREVDSSKFNFENKSGLLTYKTHIDKNELYNFFITLGEKRDIKLEICIIAHEIGDSKKTKDDENYYDHTHVFFQYSDILRSKSCRVFDYDSKVLETGLIHPNIRAVNKTPERALKYVCKSDKSLKFIWNALDKGDQSHETIYQKVLKCQNKIEVIKTCENPYDVNGSLAAWNIIQDDQRDKGISNHIPWGWNMGLLKKLRDSPSDRMILWYYSTLPNKGKSDFVDYLTSNYPDYFRSISNPGSQKDVIHTLIGFYKSGWKGHGLLVDVTMNYEFNNGFYSCLELFKNKNITDQKYEGLSINRPRCHVIVLANFPPNPFDEFGNMIIDPNRFDTTEIIIDPKWIDPNKNRLKQKQDPDYLKIFDKFNFDQDINEKKYVIQHNKHLSNMKLQKKSRHIIHHKNNKSNDNDDNNSYIDDNNDDDIHDLDSDDYIDNTCDASDNSKKIQLEIKTLKEQIDQKRKLIRDDLYSQKQIKSIDKIGIHIKGLNRLV